MRRIRTFTKGISSLADTRHREGQRIDAKIGRIEANLKKQTMLQFNYDNSLIGRIPEPIGWRDSLQDSVMSNTQYRSKFKASNMMSK